MGQEHVGGQGSVGKVDMSKDEPLTAAALHRAFAAQTKRLVIFLAALEAALVSAAFLVACNEY